MLFVGVNMLWSAAFARLGLFPCPKQGASSAARWRRFSTILVLAYSLRLSI